MTSLRALGLAAALSVLAWACHAADAGTAFYNPDTGELVPSEIGAEPLPGAGKIRMRGTYRVAAGAGNDFILNDSNADLQERNYRYLFGERQMNTYDPAIYSQYALEVDMEPREKLNLHTKVVADPWSWVGTTGEQVQKSDIGGEVARFNLKYFGANNSTLPEIVRTNVADSFALPVIKVTDGQTSQTRVNGFFDFNPATNGIPFTIPRLDIDYEFKPFRELWADYEEENWHARVFAYADQKQALTTDDPIGLSNHRDYWQQSPWLYQYVPIQHFTDGSVKRGFFNDELSFLARDSAGNRLILLRGASAEVSYDRTYFAGTVASPITPWEEEYFSPNAVPGAFRLKHRADDRTMVGATYTFRTGLVNRSVADHAQAFAGDFEYALTEHVNVTGQMAISNRKRDLLSDPRYQSQLEGYAYKAGLDAAFDHRFDGHTDFLLTYTQFDRQFEPFLSRFSNTRDDRFWGKHLTFYEYPPELEAFRFGDGVDQNRFVVRARWKEKVFKDRFMNLFDIRNVHRTAGNDFVETVIRDEATVKVTDRLTVKGLVRWQKLPKTQANVEPFLSDYYFVGADDPSALAFQNTAIPADRDPSRFTWALAAQYVFNSQWTGEVFYERSNDLPDFPRGLLNSSFRDANDRVDSLLIDHITNFLYSQGPFGAVPPYEYHTTTRQRLIWRPDDKAVITYHGAQNGYKFAAGIDDNVNHQGVSLKLVPNDKLTLFADYTHSWVVDVPKLIATSLRETDYGGHDNVYVSADWRLNSKAVLRAEYGVFGLGLDSPQISAYSTVPFSLPTIDTEHLFRVSLTGDF